MLKKITYVDSGVLIAAFQGTAELSVTAMQILDDPEREFVVSDFVRLETIPKPSFYGYNDEAEFMRYYCENASYDIEVTKELTARALNLASAHDIAPIDALHVSAALQANADEFVTTEQSTKPMFRAKNLKITSLHNRSV